LHDFRQLLAVCNAVFSVSQAENFYFTWLYACLFLGANVDGKHLRGNFKNLKNQSVNFNFTGF